MIDYALHAHDLDTSRSTGVARYALGLAAALEPLLTPDERATLVTARRSGTATTRHAVLPVKRKYLYGSWLHLGQPRFEWVHRDTDLLHVTTPVVPTPTRRPLVVTVHDLTPVTHPEWYTARAARYFRASMEWVRRRADAVLVPTAYVGSQVSDVLGLDPARITVTGEGFDPEHLACPDPTAALAGLGLTAGDYVLYLGSLSVRKGLLPVIQALTADAPTLVLAGPPGLGAEAVFEAAATCRGTVRILGAVTDEQVGALLVGATALVHPSEFEGFGLTVLEAMSVGTPVLVSNGGALPEVVGDGGFIVESRDAEAWAEGLALLRDEAGLAALREAGLRRSRAWTWDAAAAATLSVYRALLP